MEIGTIGAGALAQAFAKRALKAGHKVKLSNDRGPDSLREIVDQLGSRLSGAASICRSRFSRNPRNLRSHVLPTPLFLAFTCSRRCFSIHPCTDSITRSPAA